MTTIELYRPMPDVNALQLLHVAGDAMAERNNVLGYDFFELTIPDREIAVPVGQIAVSQNAEAIAGRVDGQLEFNPQNKAIMVDARRFTGSQFGKNRMEQIRFSRPLQDTKFVPKPVLPAMVRLSLHHPQVSRPQIHVQPKLILDLAKLNPAGPDMSEREMQTAQRLTNYICFLIGRTQLGQIRARTATTPLELA